MAELTPQQEAELTAAYLAAFNVWLPQVEAAVLASTMRFGTQPQPSAVNTTAGTWQAEIRRVEAQQLQPMASEAYSDQVADTVGAAAFVLTGTIVGAAVAASFAFLMAQVGEVQAQLSRLILGRTTISSARAVTEYLNPDNPRWAAKAATFAQTEGDRWIQAATLAGAVAAQRVDGVPREKIWVSRDDALVRPAHAMTDGQRRPLLAPFNVAGFPMMYPHDPAAPVDLVANCRCGLIITRAEATRAR